MTETRPDHARRTGPALEQTYRFLLWLCPTVEKFPRSQKFVLGDRIQAAALDVLESVIEATYTRRRDAFRARANLGIKKLRFLMRLARDLKCLDWRRYEPASEPAWSAAKSGETPSAPQAVPDCAPLHPGYALLPTWLASGAVCGHDRRSLSATNAFRGHGERETAAGTDSAVHFLQPPRRGHAQ